MKNTPKNIPLDKLHPFEGHPFKVQDNAEMDALIDSIKQQGVLSPLIVRPKENTADEYEIVSGHRRFRAAVKAGMKQVPALIVALDRNAAAVAVVDSNLHREHILPSEKAFAYKLKMEALSRQGERTDLTLSQVATKSDTASEVGKPVGESRDQVYRYIRLTNLISPILDMVDDGQVAFTPAVELSYLSENEQALLLDEIRSHECTPNLSQAQRLKEMSAQGTLSQEALAAVMGEGKANQREMFKLPMEQLRKYVPQANPKQMQDFVIKACDYYQKYLHRQRERER